MATATAPGRLRLVYADDDAAMRTMIGILLSLVDAVEVVGEAENGDEAIRLVRELDPDLVLLDVQMPVLDGPTAAEMIRTLRPHTKIVLHTAQPDDDVRRRAAALGLPLLDKMRFDDVIDAITGHEPPDERGVLPDPRVEAAVLAALTARRSQAMFLVLPDGTVPFYNNLAADLLDLPMPPQASDIDSLRTHFEILRPDGTLMPVPERLMYRAIDAHSPLQEDVIVDAHQHRTPARAAVVPFFAHDDAYVGSAIYFEPAA